MLSVFFAHSKVPCYTLWFSIFECLKFRISGGLKKNFETGGKIKFLKETVANNSYVYSAFCLHDKYYDSEVLDILKGLICCSNIMIFFSFKKYCYCVNCYSLLK